jgi:hypothetical protein
LDLKQHMSNKPNSDNHCFTYIEIILILNISTLIYVNDETEGIRKLFDRVEEVGRVQSPNIVEYLSGLKKR